MNFCLYLFISFCIKTSFCHDVNVKINQGTIHGLKIFPEASRILVHAYLGVPYASAPSGTGRFVKPETADSWNRTYNAKDYKPICPQLDSFEEHPKKQSEDCLYVNIWTPENAINIGGFPVLVVITGEDDSDWSSNRISGLDLAATGIVVVTIQYRTNVFGWLSLNNRLSPGNLALLDQLKAFEWIGTNIQKFGGDTNEMTLLGHGSMGVYCSIYHLLSPKTKGIFNRAILMSGSLFAPPTDSTVSKDFVNLLTCDSTTEHATLKCLQDKNLEELLKAYESVVRNGDQVSRFFGPTVDDDEAKSFFDIPFKLITEKNYTIDVPVLMGITSNEGAFLDEMMLNYAKQGYKKLRTYIETTYLPALLRRSNLNGYDNHQIRDAINWHYFQQTPKTTIHLLNSVIKLTSEIAFELPLLKTIELLTASSDLQKDEVVLSNVPIELQIVENESRTSGKLLDFSARGREMSEKNKLYVYVFHHSNSMDMKGNVNYFGGAQHSSDLLFLFGPSLIKQIGRQRLTQTEEKLCKKMKELFGDFIKTGNPTPGRLFDSWEAYDGNTKFIKILGTRIEDFIKSRNIKDSSFEHNVEKIEKMLSLDDEEKFVVVSNLPSTRQLNPYHLSNVNNGYDENNRISRTFDTSVVHSARNTEYYLYLRRIYSFWYEYLPSLHGSHQNQSGVFGSEQNELLENAQPKYKHAFFSMLTLVCLLLAILGVCVYILKKNNKTISSAASIL